MTTDGPRGVRVDDIEVGDTGPTVAVDDIELEDFVRFAGCTGDFSPMHLDQSVVRDAGYESVFAPGMLMGGYAMRMLAAWFGWDCIRSFDIRFSDLVLAGDSLTVEGEVVQKETSTSPAVLTVDFTVSNQDGDAVVTGSSEVETRE